MEREEIGYREKWERSKTKEDIVVSQKM